jgi:hypothetical protein
LCRGGPGPTLFGFGLGFKILVSASLGFQNRAYSYLESNPYNMPDI